MRYYHYILLALLTACSGLERSEQDRMRRVNAKAEEIYRLKGENFLSIETPKKRKREPYSFEKHMIGNHPRITKEYFRCRGSAKNPPVTLNKNTKNAICHFDCGGYDKHSLPVKEEKEFIYPVLIDLLNYIQEKTQKKVVITCGHRCPIHNVYADASRKNQSSKHLVGAEVDFYVQGMEQCPKEVVDIIISYYESQEEKAYKSFSRYTSADTDVSTNPWYNKEIFIKLYNKNEGRDFDNSHPYPYISLQMRYDKAGKRRVLYNWHQAFNGFLRW
ncbi:MAG: hypothetical protein S4CHLAM37_10590 [Chlamydiia bacterium]|nr:hypothetical protein [Chlamydiia bacterium]